MLTPLYEADIIVLQMELEQSRRDQELRKAVIIKQHEFASRMRHLAKIIEETPIDDTLKNK